MKKIVFAAFVAVSLISCKKEEKADVVATPTTTEVAPAPVQTPVVSPEQQALQSTQPAPASPVQTVTPGSTTAPVVAPAPTATTEEMVEKAQKMSKTTVALSSADHDFGNVKKGQKVQHIYEITNTGKVPLIISNVRPACGCTAPDYTKEPIAPGKKGKVTLSFDSSSFNGMQNKTAEVFTNTEKTPIILSFKANVVE